MGDAKRPERLLDLYLKLQRGERISITRVMEEYNITRRSASRDLKFLQDELPELTFDELATGVKSWYLPGPARGIHVHYNLREVMALFMGRRFFDFLEGTSLEDSFNRVYTRIESQLNSRKDLDDAEKLSQKVYLIHEGPKKLQSQNRDVLDECLTGLIYEEKLRIRYRSAKGLLRRYTIHPYTIIAYKRGLYLVAYVEQRNQIRVFSLERITSAEWCRKAGFEYPKDYDPESFFKDAMFITIGEPEHVELHFTPSTEKYIGIRQLHPTQKLSKLEGGRIRITLNVHVDFEVVNWVLSFGEHVEVIRPVKLREMVKERLEKALKQYQ